MVDATKCPIWGTTAEVTTGVDRLNVNSPRTGGRYRISGSAFDILKHRPPSLRAKLTTWIVDQRRFGDPEPMITDNIINDVQNRRRLAVSQQMERFFLLLGHREFRIGDYLKTGGQADAKYHQDTADLAAWLELDDQGREVSPFIKVLLDEGLVHIPSGSHGLVYLTSRGYLRLEDVLRVPSQSKQGFVAMWFDPTMEDAYSDGFDVGIRAAGYVPMRIDRKEHSNKIDDEIIAEIRRSRFVVADFTCGMIGSGAEGQPVARGGVYFEAGFAMGRGIPVIWTCREDCLSHVHFDTRQFGHVLWKEPSELRQKLYTRIAAVIGEVPGAPGLPQ